MLNKTATLCKHPDRPHQTKGMCASCYSIAYRNATPEAREHYKQVRRAYYERNKERENAQSSEYHRKHTDRRNAASKAWWARLTPEQRRLVKTKNRCREYGVEFAAYEALTVKQAGRCASCHRLSDLVIDQNRKTGTLRELLCPQCNLTLGHIENRGTPWVADLLRYLAKWEYK